MLADAAAHKPKEPLADSNNLTFDTLDIINNSIPQSYEHLLFENYTYNSQVIEHHHELSFEVGDDNGIYDEFEFHQPSVCNQSINMTNNEKLQLYDDLFCTY